ncbi:MAG: DUF1284 domain-containing protein [Actinomycetota bacterium]|nr:DUF1284 domain-containing protein [Actinomycetota bacterium]
MMINLRPHHLLCLTGWQGHGYDQAFTDNFNRIAIKLRAGELVRLVAGNDDICACCPKVETVDCREEFPAAIDERLLKRLGISGNSVYKLEWLNGLIKKKVAASDLDDICRGCPWLEFGWCASTLSGRI